MSSQFQIEQIEAWRVGIPMLEPFRISSGEVANKEAIVIRIRDGEAFGWGESSSMPGGFYSVETPDSCQRELVNLVLPALIGRSFDSVEALAAELTGSRFVAVAVETAAWELVARKRGISLREMFAIPGRPIPSGLAVGLYDTLDELRAALERYRARDYKRVKIKIKRGHDTALVAAAREWLGDFPLFVDANADYGLDALDIFQDLDRHGLMMFEQPFAKDDLVGLAELQRSVKTPICIDESADTLEDVRRAIALGSCRIANIKLQRVGGYSAALRIIDECHRNGIPVWMGTMPELGIGSAQALILAAHPAFAFPTDVEPSARWYVDDLLVPELSLHDGHLHLPSGPGLGFTVDEDKLDRYSVNHWVWEG